MNAPQKILARRRPIANGTSAMHNDMAAAIQPSQPNRTSGIAATWCGAVVVTLKVTFTLEPCRPTSRVEPELDPFVKEQLDSLAAASGVHESVAVPMNPAVGTTLIVPEPLWPGLETLTESSTERPN